MAREADCYSAGDRKMMDWWKALRARTPNALRVHMRRYALWTVSDTSAIRREETVVSKSCRPNACEPSCACPSCSSTRLGRWPRRKAVAAHGWHAYEVSNFAVAETHRSAHNIKYWQHTPYLGLGPSAHSFVGRIQALRVKLDKFKALSCGTSM